MLQTVLKQRAHPFALLASGLLVIALATTLSGLWHHEYELAHQTKQTDVAIEPQAPPINDQAVTVQTQSPQNSATPQVFTPSKVAGQQTQSQSNPSAASAVMPQNAPSVPPANVQVSFNVNDVRKGMVSVPLGSTQCDVIRTAYDTGLIASLDMRYSTQYKTYAVYVVDGVGDSGAIWWTYAVNGKSPPYGCGGTKAVDGDSVNWKYVKQ